MGVSKVVYGDDTLVDLTGDTVTPTSLTLGATAHGADGEPIVGEYQYTLPVASPTTRGGARIQPDSGLEITDTDNLRVRLALESDGTVRGGIAELTAKGHAEQDGTPSPDNPVPIQVVRGRNLLDESAVTDGKYLASGGTETNDAAYSISDYVPVEVGATYVTSGIGAVSSAYYAWYNSSKMYISAMQQTANGFTLTAPSNAAYVRVSLLNASLGTSQLELGSTPSPYVPYGHVGMEARDPDTDELISCTAIPLPQRGWVAGLPYGTADVLTLDGAGKVTWKLNVEKVINSTVSSISVKENYTEWRFTIGSMAVWSINPEMLCSHLRARTNYAAYAAGMIWLSNETLANSAWPSELAATTAEANEWLAQNPMTFLYPLATPVTEDCGYCEDWPTDIPEGATVIIPELDEVGIRYFVDSAVTELAKQWYARAEATIGQAVVELAERVNQLENA